MMEALLNSIEGKSYKDAFDYLRSVINKIRNVLEEKYIRGQDSMNRDPYGPM